MVGSPLTNFSNVTSLPPSSPQDEVLVDPVVLKLLRIVFYSVISITGTIGNTLVILAYRNPRMRSVTNLFIANLGVADLTVNLINAPVTVTYSSLGYWPFGSVLCKVINYLLGVTVFCSVGTLMAIAADRYRAIVHPLLPRIRTRHAIMIIAAIWTAAFIYPIPLLIYQTLDKSATLCIEAWPTEEAREMFTVAVTVVLYLIPLIVISVLYFLICHNLNTSQSTEQAGSRRTRKSVIRMLVIVVVLFTLCWLPFHVTTLYINFEGPGSQSIQYQIVMFSLWLMFANSCCNPLVYAVLNRNYRREFGRLLRCQTVSSMWYRNAESTYSRERRFSSDTRTFLRTNNFFAQNGTTQTTTRMSSRTVRGNYTNGSGRCSTDVEVPVICAESGL